MTDLQQGEGAPEGVEVTPAQVKELIDASTLTNVRLVRWEGAVSPEFGDTIDVSATLDAPRLRLQDASFSLWFDHEVEVHEGLSQIGHISTAVVLDFTVSEGFTVELPVVSCFADTNAAFMAWPYIREAVQTMSSRLGLAPITLGILARD